MTGQGANLGAREADKLQVVTWLWGTPPGASPVGQFTPAHVNRLASMLRRHLRVPHTVTCITDHDDLSDFDPRVRTFPMFYDHAEMRAGNRSCFRRLRLHDRQTASLFGPRILQVDLDCVIVGDVTPLFTRAEPLVLVTQNASPARTVYNPSLTLTDAGLLHEMWERFDAAPHETWQDAKRAGWSCSDMAVVNRFVSTLPAGDPRRPATWTREEGVCSYWRDVKAAGGGLPSGARIVLFYGAHNPHDQAAQAKSPWILEHWR